MKGRVILQPKSEISLRIKKEDHFSSIVVSNHALPCLCPVPLPGWPAQGEGGGALKWN